MMFVFKRHRVTAESSGRPHGRAGDVPRGLLDAGTVLRMQRLVGNRAVVQRFEEYEHKAIGDRAMGSGQFQLAPGVLVTYGDMVALAGDWFGDLKTLKELAGRKGLGAGTRGEVMYALLVEIRNGKEELYIGKEFDDSAKASAKKRFNALAAQNIPHFPNPRKGDAARDALAKDTGPGAVGAGATYRENHRLALLTAVKAGKAGLPIDDALLQESFGDHFLTDAFSAGHQRTERLSIKEYWHAKVPMFRDNFRMWLAEGLAHELGKHGWYELVSDDLIFSKAIGQVMEAMAAVGPITFGDLVSGAIHDYANEKGVQAEVGGQKIELVGDKRLTDKQGQPTGPGKATFNAAVAAVTAGVNEVRHAYVLGQQGKNPENVLADMAAAGGGLFAVERLLPKLADDANVPKKEQHALNWEVGSYEDLLVGPMAEALQKVANAKANSIKDLLGKLDEDQKKALKLFALDRMASTDPKVVAQLIREVINYVPSTGGGVGGHNTDDNALDYQKLARRRGALSTLTLTQKIGLVKDLASGSRVAGDEERAILDLLAAQPAEAPQLIDTAGWATLWDRIDGDNNLELIERFGSSYWAGKPFEAKKNEVGRLAGDYTQRRMDTALIVLRTCTLDEVKRMNTELKGRVVFLLRDHYRDLLGQLTSGGARPAAGKGHPAPYSGHAAGSALQYYMAARRDGTLAALSQAQRAALLRDLSAGDPGDAEERAILDVLGAQPGDAPQLIDNVGWARLWSGIDGDNNLELIERFGPAYWSSKDYQAKKTEVGRMVEKITDRRGDTALVILRTCTPSQISLMDKELTGRLTYLLVRVHRHQELVDLRRPL